MVSMNYKTGMCVVKGSAPIILAEMECIIRNVYEVLSENVGKEEAEGIIRKVFDNAMIPVEKAADKKIEELFDMMFSDLLGGKHE